MEGNSALKTPVTRQTWRPYQPSKKKEVSPSSFKSKEEEGEDEENEMNFSSQVQMIPSIDRGIYNDTQHEDQLLTLRAELERLKEDKANREAEMEITKREMVNIKSSLARNQRFLMELKDEMLDAKTKKFGKSVLNMKNLM